MTYRAHWACWQIGLSVGLGGWALAAGAAEPEPSVCWADGVTDTLAPMGRVARRAEIARLSARGERSHVLIRLAGPPTRSARAQLEASGLTLASALGGSAYFASLHADADTDALGRAGLEYIREIRTDRKLHPDLAAGVIRPWMVSLDDARRDAGLAAMLDTGSVTRGALADARLDPLVAAVVVFHSDVDALIDGPRLAGRLGGTVASDIVSVNAEVMHLPASRLMELAEDDGVMWVEPPLPALTDNNAENRAATGVDTLNASPYLLSGAGVRVLVYDGGRMYAHGDFAGRLTIGASDSAAISAHATHVGGTIGSDGTGVYAYRGMAPGVELISYGFEQPSTDEGLTPGFLYTDPGDIEADYAEAISQFGVNIANNSIGTNIEANGYPCEWTGNYGLTGSLIDAIVRGSLGTHLPIVWANGNERYRTRCLGDDDGNYGEYYSTAPPACAKNHITVGAVNSDTDEMTYFSSWGPTDDGRIKPDVSAPGCQIGGDEGVTSTTSSGPATYGRACGTSMAAPTVTGIGALILEQWRLSNPGTGDPMGATLKALLANTAVDRGNPGPDYQYGFGSVRAVDAVNAVLAGNVIEGEVTQNSVFRFTVTIGPGDPELRVTAAWDDVPGAPNVLPALVNDLDLRVIDPSGGVHLPWTLSPTDPAAPAVRTARDTLNNIEQVVIDAPAPGDYTVEVLGFSLAEGPAQTFGAVSNGTLSPCSSAGSVAFDAPTVPCSAAVGVTVRDCDLNTSNALIESVDVVVTSTTDPLGIPVTLTETGLDTAVFSGSFTFAPAGADLNANEGDDLVATYTDLDDGSGLGAVATAITHPDCTGPIFGTPDVVDIWYNTGTVVVQTNELARVRVEYGDSPATMTELNLNLPMGTTHRLPIPGLTPETVYTYVLHAEDAAGNTTTDDGSPTSFFFRTSRGPEPVLEFLVDDTDPGWSTEGDWEFGQPAGNQGDPAAGFTGLNVYGNNLDGYYSKAEPIRYLTTGPMNLTGVVETRLEFERWLGLEPVVAVGATVEVRVGAGDWQTIYKFNSGRMVPDTWTHISYLIDDIVDNQPGVQFRWSLGPTGSFADECGWNIDDVRVTGVVLATLCPVDLNGDGALNIDDLDAFVAGFISGDLAVDIDASGSLNVDDIDAFITLFLGGCP